MKYRCISYPDFEPDHTWLRKILLFVDEVHRIVPTDVVLEDSDDLKRLMEQCHGAVMRCPPQHYVEISESQAELFGKALDQPAFRKIAEKKSLQILIGPTGEREVKGWEFLHVEKIGTRVRRELENRRMIHESFGDEHWQIVPRNVAGLVLSMLANQIANSKGFDAVTDQPLAFALNSIHECVDQGSPALTEGAIASVIATVQIPREIGLMKVEDYAALRERHQDVRVEFARMVRELKESARLDRPVPPEDLRSRLDEITEEIEKQVRKFRASKTAGKVNEWIPAILTTLVPVAATYAFGPIPGLATGLFTLGVKAVASFTKKTEHFSYPRVLQTLCAANDAAAKAAIRSLAT